MLTGTAAVSSEMALCFARLTGGTADLYLRMQIARHLWLAEQQLHDVLVEQF